MQQKSIRFKGQPVHYLAGGNQEGPAILLLHGFAEDGRIWENQMPALGKHGWLLVPDIPGSGKSTLGDEKWTIDSLAALVPALLDAENRADCILVGHSMGGYIGLALLDHYPDRLRGLGLFHSTSFSDSESKMEARKKSIEFIREHGAALFVRQTTPNLFAEKFRRDNAAVLEEIVNRYANFSPEALVIYYEAMMQRPDRRHLLKDSRIPFLFIIGEKDGAVPLADSLAQCHLPSLSWVLVLEEAAHMGLWENPETCNEFLERFLTESKMAGS